MSLKQIPQKIKSFLYISAIFMVLVDIYGLGILYSKPQKEISVISEAFILDFEKGKSDAENTPESGILASKNGTKWYYTHCSGAKRIKEDNIVYFHTIQEAENRGYTQAANCN